MKGPRSTISGSDYYRFTNMGFTIVELLIVIVVIGILAAISIVAYNGIQGRARDTQRINDMKTISKALEVYKINHGAYPPVVSTERASSWELSHDGVNATNFLSRLVGSEGVSSIPVDPANRAQSEGIISPSRDRDNWVYFYYRYPAGTNGCDVSRGEFYVLGINRMDGVPQGQSHPNSPGFSCPGRDWAIQGTWITGGFVG